MNTPSLPLKSVTPTTDGPRVATPAPPPMTVGGPQDVAREGVLSAPPPAGRASGPTRGDGRFPVAWLRISVPRYGFPTATSTCLCGWDRRAVGHGKVHALITAHTAHRDTCSLRINQEERAAA